ncbi:MAG: pantoate--beta-alanine ligase [Candidatus Omnitrophota bacterium]
MKIITTTSYMIKASRNIRAENKTIALVPTMGYLHEGHLSLVRKAREECDAVIVTIFVNPKQFGKGEGLDKYPRDLEKDKRFLEKENVDILFAPDAYQMYPNGYSSYVEVKGAVTEGLCGFSRQGHFKGVATIVTKLFNITTPDKAYFGQKDAQQAVMIKQMVKDLNIPIAIRVMPIVREKDGLAMSSRNSYLSPDERKEARNIYQALKKAEEMVANDEFSTDNIKREMRRVIEEKKGLKIDYAEIVDGETLEPLKKICKNSLAVLAVFAGETRLIDNTFLKK